MVEAVVIWNEPNNLSHWDFHLDPDWERFGEMACLGASAIRKKNPNVPIVFGGVSACDCDFLRLMRAQGVIDQVDVVGVHGFPLDWTIGRSMSGRQRSPKPKMSAESRSSELHCCRFQIQWRYKFN
jgi:hypothetical protein